MLGQIVKGIHCNGCVPSPQRDHMIERIKRWLKGIDYQLVKINDTPQRKALGLGIGVFLGIFPGLGPIAALAAAFIFRVNRAAALLGSVLTNTWFSFVTLGLAIKIGSGIFGGEGQRIKDAWNDLMNDFQWQKFTEGQLRDALLAIMAGFVTVALAIGAAVYFVTLFILLQREKSRPQDEFV